MVADDLDDAEMGEIEDEGEMVEVSPVVELSLNSVVGLTTSGTFKIKGTVEDREIVVMIDCGATQFHLLKTGRGAKHPYSRDDQLWGHHGIRKGKPRRGDVHRGDRGVALGGTILPLRVRLALSLSLQLALSLSRWLALSLSRWLALSLSL